jgi:hypothetical protein
MKSSWPKKTFRGSSTIKPSLQPQQIEPPFDRPRPPRKGPNNVSVH